jgi:nitrogen fixation NifU-like protein
MTGDLGDLYQEIILDHGRSPRNHHAMECPPARSAEGFNPFCGDRLTLYVRTSDDRIEDVSFVGEGCAISQAAASILTEALKGKSIEEAEALLDAYQHALTGGDVDESKLGRLAALLGVKRFPMRVKCATLAAHTLRSALEGGAEPVTTE